MLDNYPDVLSFRQVMEITHVGRNLLLRLLNSGEIPACTTIPSPMSTAKRTF